MIVPMLVALAGCLGAAPETDPEVEVAAKVALAVREGRTLADALAAEGLTHLELDAMLFAIAADPVRAQAYDALLPGP